MRRKSTRLYLLFAALYALPLQSLQADSLWYGGLDYDVMDVTVNDRSYYPHMLSLSAGRWLVRGIGIEVQMGSGTRSNSKKGVDIGVSGYQGVYIRWQSPPRSGLQAYFLTGYSRLQLDGSVDAATNYPGKAWFNGPAVGIGLHGKLENSGHWGATVGYKHYFLEDKLYTDSVNMGLRYDF